MAKAGETQDRCTQYALDVVSGKITAGEYVRLACQRHLDDIEKSKAAPYKYYFDVEKSEEIINFAEELTIAEGEENEHVTAYPFQCFILGSLNGWRTKEKSYRRFRTSYVQLGRQNGKSFINGILACYYGNFDGYKYGKIFCTATKQDQANIVFDEVAKFINSDEDLSEWFKVHDHNHTIDCLLTHSEIKALSGDTKSLDGHRAYLGIVDEYHAHKTNQMYKLLEGGIKKLKSALISVITTAGFDLKSPCYKLYEYEGTEIELEVNALAPQDRQILFGQLYENGFLVKTADDKAPEVAVGWRERKLNGKYDFKWLYAGKFAEGISEEASTKEGKLSPTTKSIKGSFYERSLDNAYEISVDESNLVSGDTKAAEAIKAWFSKVQEKNGGLG